MTATADTRALLAACRAAPQDAHAVLLLADAMFEAGRECDAVYLRCTVNPDNDAHRHALASLWEPTDPERAELVRVQLKIARMRKGPPRTTGWDYVDRERALLAAHSDRWRRGPACERCQGYGTKRFHETNYGDPCPSCHGTGDAGGLMRRHDTSDGVNAGVSSWLHHVEHVLGCLRVHCTLAESWADGKPTEWIRAACRHHPVAEVWLTDKKPNGPTSWGFYWANGIIPDESVTACNHDIPRRPFELLAGGNVNLEGRVMGYDTLELARLALARAVALAVRLDLEERP